MFLVLSPLRDRYFAMGNLVVINHHRIAVVVTVVAVVAVVANIQVDSMPTIVLVFTFIF